MKLTAAHLERFDRDGYMFFPGLFSAAEIKVLTDEVPALYAQHRPENVREKGSDAVLVEARDPDESINSSCSVSIAIRVR